MRRLSSLVRFAMVVALAGCGGTNSNTGGDKSDMAIPADLAIGRDLTPPPVLAPTGAPCKASAECATSMAPGNAKAACTKSNMLGGHVTTWPDGYCQAPCRPSKNDASGINNSDCPGETPVCAGSGSTGTCYAACSSIADCRDDYVCANITGTPSAACVPLAASNCDPTNDPRPSMKMCPMGQRCSSFSPDRSYGGCADICDPVAQNCAPAMSGTDGCIVDYDSSDGSGLCINSDESNVEGGTCFFRNDCPAGMMCYGQKCRSYCRSGDPDAGAKGCPMGQTCKDIVVSGRTIKFKKDTTGICTP